jgi:F0F1-type ATP synthase assembly protein I
MSSTSEQEGNRRDPRQREGTRQLLLSMADTTWRMFVSPAVLVPVGIISDLKFHTKPWLTIVAAIVGMGLSILLVRQLLRGSR